MIWNCIRCNRVDMHKVNLRVNTSYLRGQLPEAKVTVRSPFFFYWRWLKVRKKTMVKAYLCLCLRWFLAQRDRCREIRQLKIRHILRSFCRQIRNPFLNSRLQKALIDISFFSMFLTLKSYREAQLNLQSNLLRIVEKTDYHLKNSTLFTSIWTQIEACNSRPLKSIPPI